MIPLEQPKLKQAVCVDNTQAHKPQTMRYIIEDRKDITAFKRKFPDFINIVGKTFKEAVDNGSVLLVSDEHPMSGFNTYCTEHKNSLCRIEK